MTSHDLAYIRLKIKNISAFYFQRGERFEFVRFSREENYETSITVQL